MRGLLFNPMSIILIMLGAIAMTLTMGVKAPALAIIGLVGSISFILYLFVKVRRILIMFSIAVSLSGFFVSYVVDHGLGTKGIKLPKGIEAYKNLPNRFRYSSSNN